MRHATAESASSTLENHLKGVKKSGNHPKGYRPDLPTKSAGTYDRRGNMKSYPTSWTIKSSTT